MGKDAERYFLVFLALLMWALSFPSLKVTLEEVQPLTLAATRFIIPLPIIFLFYIVEKGKEQNEERKKDRDDEQNNELDNERDKEHNNKRNNEQMKERNREERKVQNIKPNMERNEAQNQNAQLIEPQLNNDESHRHFDGARRFGGIPVELIMLLTFSLFNVVFPNILQNYGIRTTSSGVTSIIQGSGPIFTLVLAVFFLEERLTRIQIVGVFLAFIGSILLVTEGKPNLDGSTFGKVLILLSAISYAISAIFAKKLLRTYSSTELTYRSFLFGGSLLVIIAVLIEDPFRLIRLDIIYWGHILFLALFPTCFAYIFWYRAMKFLPLSKLAISVFLIPVMAVIFSYVFLAEKLNMFSLVTGGMVIVGVVIALVGAVEKLKNLGKFMTQSAP